MILPTVVCVGVPFPFDQILLLLPSAVISLVQNGLNFIFLLSVDDVWGWFKVIGSVFGGFLVR
jgi:hypothetical protein